MVTCPTCGAEGKKFLSSYICKTCNKFFKPVAEKKFKQRTDGQKRSIKQEKKLAETYGGKRTLASGALWEKDDVVSDRVRVEAKSTRKDFYILHFEDLKKVEEHCEKLRVPIFAIHFHGREQFYVIQGSYYPDTKVFSLVSVPAEAKSVRLEYSKMPIGDNRLVLSRGDQRYVIINSKFIPDELLGDTSEPK